MEYYHGGILSYRRAGFRIRVNGNGRAYAFGTTLIIVISTLITWDASFN